MRSLCHAQYSPGGFVLSRDKAYGHHLGRSMTGSDRVGVLLVVVAVYVDIQGGPKTAHLYLLDVKLI